MESTIDNQEKIPEDYSDIKEFLLTNKFKYDYTVNYGAVPDTDVKHTAFVIFDLNTILFNQKSKSWYGYGKDYETNCFTDSKDRVGKGGLIITNEEKRIIWEAMPYTKHELKINSLSKNEKQATYSTYYQNTFKRTYVIEIVSDEDYNNFIESISGLCECDEVPKGCTNN
jgi:hypothetical protein